MNFSQNLKYLMSEKNINQLALANIAGVSQRTISSWLNAQNEPSAFSIIRIADYFGVSVDYLLGRVDDFGSIPYATPTAPALTEKEEELVATFRRMPEGAQAIALDTMHSLAGDNAHAQSVRISHKRA